MNLCEANIIAGTTAAAAEPKEKKRGADAATERLVTAMQQYTATGTGYRVSDATEYALHKIALKNWAAKAELREILRKSPNWNEELQETTAEVVIDTPVDWRGLRGEIRHYIRCRTDYQTYNLTADALCVIDDITDAVQPTRATAAYKALTGHDYRLGRKATRVIREILQACGAWDDTAGSECQKQFAAWANQLTKQREARALHLSICPAIQLTQSNPHEDDRGPTLISCHSLDCENYGYSAGNSGYSIDTVTMIAYTCAGDDRYTRKTSRQLYMYSDGTLLQSRLYDTHGANDRAGEISAAYRATVQAIIADCLGMPNDWTEPENAAYCDYIHTNSGFGGYPDYKYSATGCTVSHLTAWDGYSSLCIGGPGICISCGAYTYDDCGATCPDCDNDYGYCAWCGDRCSADSLTDTDDDGLLCDYCLQARGYQMCDCCGDYTRNTYYIAGTGEALCESCFDSSDYEQCDECTEWFAPDDVFTIRIRNSCWYNDGVELRVCPSCRGNLQAAGQIMQKKEED